MRIETKTTLLKAAMIAAGAFCMVIFLAVRIRGGAELLLDPHEYYTGRDLYKESYIDHFRESHPAFDTVTNRVIGYDKRPENPPVNDADILTFGDSYFNFRLLPSFPELLGRALDRRVYFRRHHNPFRILKEEGYTADRPRMLIYEIGERGIHRKFIGNPFIDGGRTRNEDDTGPWFRILQPGEAEQRYTALLQLSRWTHRWYKRVATFKFDAFGYISPMTPVYSLDPPFLFLATTVDDSPYSYYYRHSEEEIAAICDNILRVRDRLREEYDLEMVFLPIPNKISIHGELVTDVPYNDFLPRLYRGLSERDVHVIDLYHPFNAADDLVYFASDTHWNENGIDLAVQATLDYLEQQDLLPLTGP